MVRPGAGNTTLLLPTVDKYKGRFERMDGALESVMQRLDVASDRLLQP